MKLIKKALKLVNKSISYVLSFIFSLKLYNYFYLLKKNIIGYSFKRNLMKCGKNVNIGINNSFVGLNKISIGDNFFSGDGLWLATYTRHNGYLYSPFISIGNNVKLSRYCHIAAINKIVIGSNVMIGSNVLIEDHSHGNTIVNEISISDRPLCSKGEIIIGNNVWIGDNVVILAGVEIGDNCIIGANAVVNRKFEANQVIAGVPARVVKQLEREEN